MQKTGECLVCLPLFDMLFPTLTCDTYFFCFAFFFFLIYTTLQIKTLLNSNYSDIVTLQYEAVGLISAPVSVGQRSC